MQFVEDEEGEIAGSYDETSFVGSSQQQFQHHIVGEQNIWRFVAHLIPDLHRGDSVGGLRQVLLIGAGIVTIAVL